MNNPSQKQHVSSSEEMIVQIFTRNPKERDLLRKKHLVIVGAGSVGSAIAVMAARAGIETFTIIDHDDIEPENLGRHMCDTSHLFRSKAFAVTKLIEQINPDADVRPVTEDFRTV